MTEGGKIGKIFIPDSIQNKVERNGMKRKMLRKSR
jgi:hypothetical protein